MLQAKLLQSAMDMDGDIYQTHPGLKSFETPFAWTATSIDRTKFPLSMAFFKYVIMGPLDFDGGICSMQA